MRSEHDQDLPLGRRTAGDAGKSTENDQIGDVAYLILELEHIPGESQLSSIVAHRYSGMQPEKQLSLRFLQTGMDTGSCKLR